MTPILKQLLSDTDAVRNAINKAISDYKAKHPNVDILLRVDGGRVHFGACFDLDELGRLDALGLDASHYNPQIKKRLLVEKTSCVRCFSEHGEMVPFDECLRGHNQEKGEEDLK